MQKQNSYGFWLDGACYARLGQYRKAIKSFDESKAKDPKYLDAIFSKAYILQSNLSHQDAAIKCYNELLEIDPNHVMALNNLGWCYHQQKKYAQAIPFYDRALKQDKKYVNVWDSKAVTLYKLKKYPQALICCKKAVKLGTKDKEVLSCFEKIKKKLRP